MGPQAYLVPLLTTVVFAYSALSLFPFIPASVSRMIALDIVGLGIVYILWSFAWAAIHSRQTPYFSPIGWMFGLFYLLLWLRVYDLRVATELREEPGISPRSPRSIPFLGKSDTGEKNQKMNQS